MIAADPLILRKARKEDLAAIANVHLQAFPGFFLTELGPRFLTQYYAAVLAYDGGILITATRDGAVLGFVSGFVEPSRFYRTMRAMPHRYLIAAMAGVVRRPSLILRLAGNVMRVRREAVKVAGSHECELSSLAVSPQIHRGGTGRRLVGVFLEQAWAMGATSVRLTTDANGNEGVNRFYSSLGFRAGRSLVSHGNRLMREYVIDRSPTSERVDAAPQRTS